MSFEIKKKFYLILEGVVDLGIEDQVDQLFEM